MTGLHRTSFRSLEICVVQIKIEKNVPTVVLVTVPPNVLRSIDMRTVGNHVCALELQLQLNNEDNYREKSIDRQ